MAKSKQVAVAEESAGESVLPLRDDSGLLVKSEKGPEPAKPATLLYETLMGLACPGPNGYRYLQPGELIELGPEAAAPLLSSGAIKLAE